MEIKNQLVEKLGKIKEMNMKDYWMIKIRYSKIISNINNIQITINFCYLMMIFNGLKKINLIISMHLLTQGLSSIWQKLMMGFMTSSFINGKIRKIKCITLKNHMITFITSSMLKLKST